MNWKLSDDERSILLSNGENVRLPGKVETIVPCGDINVILLQGELGGRNVIALNQVGNLMWRFEPKGRWKLGFSEAWHEGDNVRLLSPEGYAVVVDLVTGEQLTIEQTK